MSIRLVDDGTLDTVLRCSQCNEWFRYNYDPCGSDFDQAEEGAYDAFVEWALDDVEMEHVCGEK